MGRKSRLFAHSRSSPDSRFGELEGQIAKSLRPCPRISPFAEIIGGDWFDHCGPRAVIYFTTDKFSNNSTMRGRRAAAPARNCGDFLSGFAATYGLDPSKLPALPEKD
jgi:hypothetical protein